MPAHWLVSAESPPSGWRGPPTGWCGPPASWLSGCLSRTGWATRSGCISSASPLAGLEKPTGREAQPTNYFALYSVVNTGRKPRPLALIDRSMSHQLRCLCLDRSPDRSTFMLIAYKCL